MLTSLSRAGQEEEEGVSGFYDWLFSESCYVVENGNWVLLLHSFARWLLRNLIRTWSLFCHLEQMTLMGWWEKNYPLFDTVFLVTNEAFLQLQLNKLSKFHFFQEALKTNWACSTFMTMRLIGHNNFPKRLQKQYHTQLLLLLLRWSVNLYPSISYGVSHPLIIQHKKLARWLYQTWFLKLRISDQRNAVWFGYWQWMK